MTKTTFADLGWSDYFASELDGDMLETHPPARVSEVHRDRVLAFVPGDGEITLDIPQGLRAGEIAVGDWVTTDLVTRCIHTVLPRKSEVSRKAAGLDSRNQLIAANVDTLMIVTSCNADFNPARLERYLALASSAGAQPLIVLTKADTTTDAAEYRIRAERLSPMVTAVSLNALDPEGLATLSPWLKTGQTAALVGSSGVGKSTILNGLTGGSALTQDIREDDAKGRHTTTARSLRRTFLGGWLIDTPGMRSLPLNDSADGIAQVFSDLADLVPQCKFSDCRHGPEPGCAIQAAIKAGDIDEDRLHRWQKLVLEDQHNSESVAHARARQKTFGKKVKSTVKAKSSKKRS